MPDEKPEIELEDSGSKGRYVFRDGGAEAEMTKLVGELIFEAGFESIRNYEALAA